ncbi:uncharacterized protein LOC131250506 isoform X2 [Magnolia sinica]|uniref:uncharacterized protein LOC131250506 isoform X2 n=1 Tax=Magnolia sinica TaxID=86752 RepID=UPI002659A372|nr:uncharacterized protein LOC131250506 isoform X2 [Magnolia sinica]
MASAVAVAFNRIERAHQLYRDGRHDEALAFYTEALAMAKTKAQKIALHSNRAACYLKLHDFKKSLTPIPESEEEAFEAELEEALEAELEEEAMESELEDEESMKAELKEKTMEADDQQENAVGAVVISDRKAETPSNNSKLSVTQAESLKDTDLHPKGWEAIPKPKGHSGLDYSRWDQVEDDSSEEDEAEDVQPQYRFRVRTVGVRPVK